MTSLTGRRLLFLGSDLASEKTHVCLLQLFKLPFPLYKRVYLPLLYGGYIWHQDCNLDAHRQMNG